MNTNVAIILFLFFFIHTNVCAQWSKTAGPPGIRATKFYESGNVLYVGTDAQGVYKSLDHGITWTAANTGIENRQVLSLMIFYLHISLYGSILALSFDFK